MLYCPKCGAEYPLGNTRCSDCDCELIEKPPDKKEDYNFDSKIVLLCQTNDIVSAGMLEEALKEKNIPCLAKSRMGTFSGYMPLDRVMKGIKIFVPESALKKAVEIAETIIPDFERPDENN
ncbi:MAG: DUF2007 domain-containing protein [candidate division Zixibacteria bacterium]|nr:DUF2007 domain-containing protein [candidate division Zixibacteria bacterium]